MRCIKQNQKVLNDASEAVEKVTLQVSISITVIIVVKTISLQFKYTIEALIM